MSGPGAAPYAPGERAPGASADLPMVRDARDSDAPGLVALVGACFSEYEGCVLDTDTEMVHLLAVATHFAAAGGRAWMVEPAAPAAESIVGSVACRPATDPGGLELQMLYVMSSWRRHGLGSRLVTLVEEEAKGREARFVDLWSDTRFTDAHRLYRTLGYDQLPDVRHLHDLSDTSEFHFVKTL
jgi:putative acetyltransferase